MKTNKTIYELTLSQKVSIIQLMFMLDKRSINIPSSLTFDNHIDYDTMNKAWDMLIERNDTLRLYQFKQGKHYKQIFRDHADSKYDLRKMSFASEAEFDKWFLKYRKKPLKYLKGQIYDAIYMDLKWNKKTMLFVNYAHTIIDIYGIGIITKDLAAILEHLTKGKELPAAPALYEEVVRKDLSIQLDKNHFNKEVEFFYDWLKSHPIPQYEGISGNDEPIMKKRREKGIRNVPMFFIKNDTEGYNFKFDPQVSKAVNDYCMEHKYTPSNVYYFLVHTAIAKVNEDRGLMMPCLLNNMRGTNAEKNTAGCKVQSVQSYVTVDFEKNLNENMEKVMEEYMISMRHIGFDDQKFQFMWREIYKAPFLGTFFTMTYSFIPMVYPKGMSLRMYDNGKFCLPLYFDIMCNAETGLIEDVIYCAQTKLVTKEQVERFQRVFEDTCRQLIKSPDKKLKDIKINLK